MLGQHRSTQRHRLKDDADEQRLTADIVALANDLADTAIVASMHCWVMPAGRSAHQRWSVSGGGRVSKCRRGNQTSAAVVGRGIVHPVAPQHRGHVWFYDFLEDQNAQRPQIQDAQHHRRVQPGVSGDSAATAFRSNDVIDVLTELFIEHGPPEPIRSDNGPEFVANAVREWLGRLASSPCISSQGVLWRTAISRASMLACATNCSTARSSTVSRRCGSSPAGGGTITTVPARTAALVIVHQHRKPSRCQLGLPVPLCSASATARIEGAHQYYATGPVIAGSPIAGRHSSPPGAPLPYWTVNWQRYMRPYTASCTHRVFGC